MSAYGTKPNMEKYGPFRARESRTPSRVAPPHVAPRPPRAAGPTVVWVAGDEVARRLERTPGPTGRPQIRRRRREDDLGHGLPEQRAPEAKPVRRRGPVEGARRRRCRGQETDVDMERGEGKDGPEEGRRRRRPDLRRSGCASDQQKGNDSDADECITEHTG
ncbi:hypothetical protein E2562_022939 [Oryza meyeriana var. granulata]|uniref:Uncharacterized protein n=1 Tax=Oryza meyeriana var. granulata TaxID=110450 RepID=A0A6G1D5R1_9ORYZ|nr:hypothetical protein E2562_022939 [Oryza meyeriana var. granulata]